MKYTTIPMTIILLLLGAITSAQDKLPLQLTPENHQAWVKHIQPSETELAWTEIDWQPDLKSGISKAAESGKPILLWTMNGHPLGCT